MSQFRAKKLDLGCYVNARNIRDHTKRSISPIWHDEPTITANGTLRKVFAQYETQR